MAPPHIVWFNRMIVVNWTLVEQFVLILMGFICMGAGCGFERSLLPRMAVQTFHEVKSSTRLMFVATFGLSKAVANAVAGPLADRFGRKPVLVWGCLIGLPVMPFVIICQTWNGIIIMNGAFGLSQGLLGSSLFFLLIDLLGPRRRGVAVGVGESTIYVSTAVINILAGRLAYLYDYRPVPFYVATGFSVVGLLSTIPLKDTLDQARAEQTASQRERRKKYARMMSTQPSHLDEEAIIAKVYLEKAAPTIGNSEQAPKNGRQTPLRTTSHSIPSTTHDDLQQQESGLSGYVSPWKLTERSNLIPPPPPPPDDAPQSLTQSPAQSPQSKVKTYQAVSFSPLPSPAHANGKTYKTMSFSPLTSSGHPSTGMASSGSEESLFSLLDQMEPGSPYQTLKDLLFNNPSYVTLCLSGMALNFKDGFAWGSFPVFFRHEHSLTESETDFLVALYPLCWGFAQAFTGYLSDHFGRKIFLVSGTAMCTIAMALFALPNYLWGAVGDIRHVRLWEISDVLLGLGTAMVYPALQAGAADEVEPINRGLALGFYRFIRDMGYVVGALVCGHLTDMIGYEKTFLVNAGVLGAALLGMIFIYEPPPEIHLPTDELPPDVVEKVSKQKGAVPKMLRILMSKCSDSF